MQNEHQPPNEPNEPQVPPQDSFRVVPDFSRPQSEASGRGGGPQAADIVNDSWRLAWQLFRADPVVLPMAGLTVSVLSSLTLGILLGPLAWGLFGMCWASLHADKPMRVGEVFREFGPAGTSIGIGLLSAIGIMLGYILLVIPGLYLTVALMYALPIGLAERRGVGDAMRQSVRRVHAHGFWPHAALALTLVAMGWALSALFDWVGSAIALAIALPVIACAYDRFIRAHTVAPS